MNIFLVHKILVMSVLALSMPIFANEPTAKQKLKNLDRATVVLHDEIIINRAIEEVWPKLLRFPLWYFAGENIERISGEQDQLGYTLAINNHLAHSIASVRPMKSVVWKTCVIASCDKKYNFTDFMIREVNGKTLLSRSLYSQGGFWPKTTVENFHSDQSYGKVPEMIRKASVAFKDYLENHHE